MKQVLKTDFLSFSAFMPIQLFSVFNLIFYLDTPWVISGSLVWLLKLVFCYIVINYVSLLDWFEVGKQT